MYMKIIRTNFHLYWHRSWSISYPYEAGHIWHIGWFMIFVQSLPSNYTVLQDDIDELVRVA